MIQALVDLSYQRELTGREPFAARRIHWFLDLDTKGRCLGVAPAVPPCVTSGGPQATDSGIEIQAPVAYFAMVRPHGVAATAGGGLAVAEPGAGNIAEIFGVVIEAQPAGQFRTAALREQDIYKHTNFVDLHRQLTKAAPRNQTIQAVWTFLTSRDPLPLEQFSASQLRKLPTQQLSFRVAGRLLLDEPELRHWWTREFTRQRSLVEDNLNTGRDLVRHTSSDDGMGPLATVFPRIVGIPGSGAWCPLASFDKAPYQSFGLGKGTLPLRLESTERAAAALNWLLRDAASHVRLGSAVAVFWSETAGGRHQPMGDEIVSCLTQPNALQAKTFLESAQRGKHPAAVDGGSLHAAILSSPQSRVTVRSWRAAPQSQVRDHLRHWLESTAVPAPFGDGIFYPSLGELAAGTVRHGGGARLLARTFCSLFESALFAVPLPRRLLAQALDQQARDLAVGHAQGTRAEFERRLASRTALFQAFLQRSPTGGNDRGAIVLENEPAYLCGRLLAILDRIHALAYQTASGHDTSPATRAYARASRSPALVLPRLCQRARHSLRDIGGGLALILEIGRTGIPVDGLRAVVRKLDSYGTGFPRTLHREDQARLGLGFYHERRQWWASRKTRDSESATTATATEA